MDNDGSGNDLSELVSDDHADILIVDAMVNLQNTTADEEIEQLRIGLSWIPTLLVSLFSSLLL